MQSPSPIVSFLASARHLGVGALAAALALATVPGAAAECSAPLCARSGPVQMTVQQFRAGNRGDQHWAQANFRIANAGRTPLTLGYVDGSGQLLDENGNTYKVIRNGARGIGIVERNRVDTSFVLQPGETADARFEFDWLRGPQARTGLTFQMSMSLREVSELPGGQVKIGREHLLRWTALGDGAAAGAAAAAVPAGAAPAAAPIASGGQAVAPVAAAGGDLCADRPACHASGSFTTEVTRVASPVKTTYAQELMVTVTFRATNHGATPLILGFNSDSGQLIDQYGERWVVKAVHRERIAGIGQVRRGSADPQFVLQPGESRPFTLGFARTGAPNGARGFSADLVLAQMEILPGNQIRTVREHAVSFPQIAIGAMPSGAGASAATGAATEGGDPADAVKALRELRDMFKKR
jgi:hypothetical protein